MMRSICIWMMSCFTLFTVGFEGADASESGKSHLANKTEIIHSLDQGLDWLKSIQQENGSWSNQNYPAMTALGLWAFSRSQHPDKASICAKAAAFIVTFVQPDGGIYKPAGIGRGSGGLSTYNTAICMTALHAYDKAKYTPIILKAREFVAGSQLQGDSFGAGGFGYNSAATEYRGMISSLLARRRKPRADLSNTGWALMAMRYTQDVEDLRPEGETVDIDWDAALKFVSQLQDMDKNDPVNQGGFGYEPQGEHGKKSVNEDGTVKLMGFGSMTYAGLESMIYAQVDHTDPRVRSALEWASRHWSVDENPGMGTKGLFYYFNVMGKALHASGVDQLPQTGSQTVIAWRDQIAAKLISMQREDGSWINENGRFWEGDAMLVTAYAVLTLEYVLGW